MSTDDQAPALPHLTDLLDLEAAVHAGAKAVVKRGLMVTDPDRHAPDDAELEQFIADLRVVDRQALRSDVLRVLYPGARVIAEQAYDSALADAGLMLSEQATIHFSDTGPHDPRGVVLWNAGRHLEEKHANPFAEGAVAT